MVKERANEIKNWSAPGEDELRGFCRSKKSKLVEETLSNQLTP